MKKHYFILIAAVGLAFYYWKSKKPTQDLSPALSAVVKPGDAVGNTSVFGAS